MGERTNPKGKKIPICERCGFPIDDCKCVCPYCGESSDCLCCTDDAVTGG